MVICKFFQLGSCRYGQSCRFEHVYGSKYSYHAPQNYSQNQNYGQNVPTQPSSVTDEQLVHQVQTDVQSALRGHQWVLSSYAPFKEKPCMPGIPDLSPEEARLFIYEAKANNTVDQAVAYMNNLFKESRNKYEQLLQPSESIVKVLRNLYKGEVASSPFNNPTQSSGFGSSNNSSSVFNSALQTQSVFGQNTSSNTSIFGQQANSVFGQSPDPAKSIFSQATQNTFGSPTSANVFGSQSPDTAKSIFAQASQNVFASPPQQTQANPTNLFASASQQFFGQTQNPPDPFGQSAGDPFRQTPNSSPFQNSTPTNVFQRPEQPVNVFRAATQNVFGAATPNAFEQQNDESIYSKVEDLTADDLEAFKSEEFRLGFIPEMAPTRELCV